LFHSSRVHCRNPAVTSGATSTTEEDSNKAEDLTRSEVATATAATTPSHHREREGTRHSGGETSEEDLASAVVELSQIALDFSLLIAQLGVVADRLNGSMSENR
jgi:hypothetical protein